ncbi:MAG TPA: chromate efflux transporter [Thermoanaerobaculia bacterium]|nr:chromate efflux transporter [Thermoanaerobaculia bacterium]
MSPRTPDQASAPVVPFGDAFRVWCRVAALSFGGPAGQIAVMQRILCDERRWVSQDRFLYALNYCMLLPGPEAQQLATYVGWLLHRTPGGLVAGILFVLPGFLSILALSVLYAGFGEMLLVAALFFGLKPAVLAIVVEALVRIGRRALHSGASRVVAAGAFVAIFFFDAPFPWIVGAAALIGWWSGRWRRRRAEGMEASGSRKAEESLAARPALLRAARVATVWVVLWWAPVLALLALLGGESVFVQEGLFFSKASVVTFGGAYAVLAYVAQRAVEDFGWLAPGEMLDGLGMAETTPGPLIQVVQFVGFMGAYRFPGTLDPMLAGILGSLVVTWVTFVPCFLWIFLGAPDIEWLRGRRALSDALSAITAAVVGVILNLAVWFALHTLFAEVSEVERGWLRLFVPVWRSVEWGAVVIAAGAFVALFGLRWGMLRTLAASVGAGLAWTLVGWSSGG